MCVLYIVCQELQSLLQLLFTQRRGTVFEPFGGTLSGAIPALMNGRTLIACEKDAVCYTDAINRMRHEIRIRIAEDFDFESRYTPATDEEWLDKQSVSKLRGNAYYSPLLDNTTGLDYTTIISSHDMYTMISIGVTRHVHYDIDRCSSPV
jgi:hypothetical protein